MNSQWVLHNRTFWVNLITATSMFIALPELANILPESSVRYLLLVQAALNIALRFTSALRPVTLNKPTGDTTDG